MKRKVIILLLGNGKLGVDMRLLKHYPIDFEKASEYIRSGFPGIKVTKKRPINYKPSDIVYGIKVPRYSTNTGTYLCEEGAEVLSSIKQLRVGRLGSINQNP